MDPNCLGNVLVKTESTSLSSGEGNENSPQRVISWEQKYWNKTSNGISHVLHQLSEAVAAVIVLSEILNGTELMSFFTEEHLEGDRHLHSLDTKENHSRMVFFKVKPVREAVKMLSHFKAGPWSPPSRFLSKTSGSRPLVLRHVG